MFIPRASPTLAPTARLCLLLLLSPRVFRAVAFSFVFYYFSLWVGVFFGRVLLLTKKLRTLRAQLPRVKLIVYSRYCPNCPNHPHLELPPPLLRALFNLRAAPHLPTFPELRCGWMRLLGLQPVDFGASFVDGPGCSSHVLLLFLDPWACAPSGRALSAPGLPSLKGQPASAAPSCSRGHISEATR